MPFRFTSLTTGGAAGAPLFVVVAPLPPSPWHSAHWSAKTEAPRSDVPLPAGKPAPLGSMSMSHAAKSAGLIGFPSFGPWPNTAPDVNARLRSAASRTVLCVRMGNVSLLVDRPACDRVEVMVLESKQRRH